MVAEERRTSPPQLDATTLAHLSQTYGAHFTEETIEKAIRQRFKEDRGRVTGPSYSPTYNTSPHYDTFAVGIAAPEEKREHKRHKTARIHTAKTRQRLAVTFFTTKSGTKDKGGNSPHERVNAAFLRQCVLLTAAAIGTIFKATFNAPGETFCGKLITKANTEECYRNAWLILAIFDLFVLHPKLESICKYCVTITSATPPTEPLSSPTTQIVFLHQQILIGIEIVHDVMEVHAMCNCIRTPHDPPPWTRKCCTRCSDVQRKHITVLSVVSLIEPHTFRMPFSQVFNPNLLNPRTAPYNIARTPTGFIPESTKRYNEVNDIVSSFDC